MKWLKPDDLIIVEKNDPVTSDDEYYNVVNPIRDVQEERNRVIGWVYREKK